MKRTTRALKPLISIIIILLSLVLLNQSLAFALSNSYATIASSGTIRETTGVRKHIVAYGLGTSASEDLIQHLAKFDIVDIDSSSCGLAHKIKASNPKAIVIAYSSIMSMHTSYSDWNEVNSHEDWFLHDVNGNRIRAVGEGFVGWYGMDVGNLGWREHFANRVKALLETYPSLDGIFADNAWNTFMYYVWNVSKEQLSPNIGSRWHSDMLGMISFVKEIIGSKLLIVNTSNNDDYVDACDGKMEEGFVHASWQTFDQFISKSSWFLEVDSSLEHVSKRGKYYLALGGTKIPENPTDADLEKARAIMMYCLCSYLLGVNGTKATFGFNFINSNDGSLGYYPEFDATSALGSPITYFYSFTSVYSRDFSTGRVLVNPTTYSYTVSLGSEYKTLDGQMVSSVTLGAHSGIILLKP